MPSSTPLPLTKDAIHVWQVSLCQSTEQLNLFWHLLDREEQNRANRLLRPEHRSGFIVAHAVLRYLIAFYVNCQPYDLVFKQTSYGKSMLAAVSSINSSSSSFLTPTTIHLRFNLSHSHDIAMYAIALNREVGIDVEYLRTDFVIADIAQRFFAREEAAALAVLPHTEQSQAFFNCWTRKEAFIKAIGQGLSYGLDSFAVDLVNPNNITKLKLVINDDNFADNWSLFNLITLPQYCAALVVEGKVTPQQIMQYNYEDYVEIITSGKVATQPLDKDANNTAQVV